MISWLLAVAWAAEFEVHPKPLIEPLPGTWYENGVGAPTVEYSEALGLYVMLFESRIKPADDICPVGYWGLGAAWSKDGLAWNIHPEPVAVPEADGTSHECVIAHPSLMLDGTRWRLWFKAEQRGNACAVEEPLWGCRRMTGVGYASGRIRVGTPDQVNDQIGREVDELTDGIVGLADGLLGDLEPWAEEADLARGDLVGGRGRPSDDARLLQDAIVAADHVLRDLRKGNLTKLIRKDLGALIASLEAVADGVGDANLAGRASDLIEALTALHTDPMLDEYALIRREQKSVEAGGTDYDAFRFDLLEAPVAPTYKFGFPSVVEVDGTWHMLIAKRNGAYLATSDAPDTGWSAFSGPVIRPGVTYWAKHEIFNPAMVCEDDAHYPYTTFFGGRNYANGGISAGGWGDAISADGRDWWVNGDAQVTWIGDGPWRHWDARRTKNEYLVWYSAKDTGAPYIGFASTTSTWKGAEIAARACTTQVNTQQPTPSLEQRLDGAQVVSQATGSLVGHGARTVAAGLVFGGSVAVLFIFGLAWAGRKREDQLTPRS